jgi:spermidine/putrescine transport system permease protein
MNKIINKKLSYRAIMVPYVMWLAVFIVAPLILILWFSFTDLSGNFTFDNIINVGKYSNVFLTSIWLGFLSTLICFVLGYPMAYFISKIDALKQNIIIMILMVPMWMSFLLRTYAWMTILENNGLLNSFLRALGFNGLNLINTRGAIILGMVYNFIPYMVLQIYSVLIKIDKSLIEAAQDLGANKLMTFIKVIFPLSVPGVISGITMVFVPAVSTFIISKMLGGGANLLIGDLIEMQFLGNIYNPHLGSAISLFLIFLILICMGITNQFDHDDSADENIVI